MKLKKKNQQKINNKTNRNQKNKKKLNIKNKWEDTLEVFQKEKREREESPPEPNCFSFMNT